MERRLKLMEFGWHVVKNRSILEQSLSLNSAKIATNFEKELTKISPKTPKYLTKRKRNVIHECNKQSRRCLFNVRRHQ